jgi:predicted O-linked N-acetylglucosamine transferase (SPINDLY family)
LILIKIGILNLQRCKKIENNLDYLLENTDLIPIINIPFYINHFYYLSFIDNNNNNIRKKICKLNRIMFPQLNYTSNNITKHINNKIKVGFISTNFKLHSVGRDRIGVIRGINRDLFDVVIFHFDKYPDDIYWNLALNSGFKNIILNGGINDWRQRIENENLNILVYADIGMQEETYLLAYSRLAPIQITTIGHSESSGIDTIDYYLSSELFEPSNGQENYSEKLILQKSIGMFYYDKFYDLIYNKINDPNKIFLDPNIKYLSILQYLHKNM